MNQMGPFLQGKSLDNIALNLDVLVKIKKNPSELLRKKEFSSDKRGNTYINLPYRLSRARPLEWTMGMGGKLGPYLWGD